MTSSSLSGPVLCVAGARPNFMKVAPILRALGRRGIDTVLVHTGQHYDAAMSDVFFDELGIDAPDHFLDVGAGSHAVQTASVMQRFEPVLLATAPAWVVVVGDVNSTVACALVAAKEGIPVAHVEAGLRSGDRSMPEELNRLVTDRLSELLLAPSPDAVDHLLSEGCPPEWIELVGNVMIDTLLATRARAEASGVIRRLGLESDFALLTLHRPSNVDDPRVLAGILDAVGTLAEAMPIVWPVHPRVDVDASRCPAGIRLIEPVGYVDSIALQDRARVVLTDSGGMQEETTVLGTPCLTLRTSTERPITVSEGTNRVVGVEPGAIRRAIEDELARPTAPRRPALWDGRAAERIVDALVSRAPAADPGEPPTSR